MLGGTSANLIDFRQNIPTTHQRTIMLELFFPFLFASVCPLKTWNMINQWTSRYTKLRKHGTWSK